MLSRHERLAMLSEPSGKQKSIRPPLRKRTGRTVFIQSLATFSPDERRTKNGRRRKQLRTLMGLQGYVCPHCSEPLSLQAEGDARPNADHVIPKKYVTGMSTLVNMMAAHYQCNYDRGTLPLSAHGLKLWYANHDQLIAQDVNWYSDRVLHVQELYHCVYGGGGHWASSLSAFGQDSS